ncbi:MAG TPA: hypothetical protein VIF64_03225 [Pyrinomonadaceae bacterium]|jgi:hypothetical protein
MMREGWLGDKYIVLFEEQASSLEEAYGFFGFLPGFRLIGLHGWDDFLVEDSGGNLFTVDTVPLLKERIRSFIFEESLDRLISDDRLRGKIKWYVQPLVFSGNPALESNVDWITLAQHTQLVQWWNKKYRELASEA